MTTEIRKPFFFQQTVLGHLQSKSNSRRIVRRGNRFASIKSQGAMDFVETFLIQAKAWKKPERPFEGDVNLRALVFYPSRRNDLDISLLMDCLQAGTPDRPMAGIIKNDRQIKEIHAVWALDTKQPRVEFTVYEDK